ncbi:MAG: ABC transporter permease [Planctomyces sp.]|nr:ABC transporter permease [Planctomyces sp.]
MSSTAAVPSSLSSAALAALSLAFRELRRFFRQRTRIVGALGQPLIFWILFGAGLGGTFRMSDANGVSYAAYFLPGVAVMIVLFTAIFSTISIIEDRREGFLQGVLVSPIPRSSLVLGKILGGTCLAVLQALVFIGIAPVLSRLGVVTPLTLDLTVGQWVAATVWMAAIAFVLTALGYLIAWPMESTQGFHAVMSVFLMPMWLLSGAFFPVPASGWLHWIMRANPLTYGVAGLRRLMTPEGTPLPPGLPSWGTCLLVTGAMAAGLFAADVALTRWKRIAGQ